MVTIESVRNSSGKAGRYSTSFAAPFDWWGITHYEPVPVHVRVHEVEIDSIKVDFDGIRRCSKSDRISLGQQESIGTFFHRTINGGVRNVEPDCLKDPDFLHVWLNPGENHHWSDVEQVTYSFSQRYVEVDGTLYAYPDSVSYKYSGTVQYTYDAESKTITGTAKLRNIRDSYADSVKRYIFNHYGILADQPSDWESEFQITKALSKTTSKESYVLSRLDAEIVSDWLHSQGAFVEPLDHLTNWSALAADALNSLSFVETDNLENLMQATETMSDLIKALQVFNKKGAVSLPEIGSMLLESSKHNQNTTNWITRYLEISDDTLGIFGKFRLETKGVDFTTKRYTSAVNRLIKRLRSIANARLTYTYSIKCTALDCKELYDAATKPKQNTNLYRAYATGESYDSKVRNTIVYYCREDLSKTFFQDFISETNNTGMLPLASRLWDLVPYSFVVDWFGNIGGNLQQLETQFGYNYSGYTVVASSRSGKYTDFLVNPHWVGSIEVELYQRAVAEGYSAVEAEFSPGTGLNIDRTLNGIALFVQRL